MFFFILVLKFYQDLVSMQGSDVVEVFLGKYINIINVISFEFILRSIFFQRYSKNYISRVVIKFC